MPLEETPLGADGPGARPRVDLDAASALQRQLARLQRLKSLPHRELVVALADEILASMAPKIGRLLTLADVSPAQRQVLLRGAAERAADAAADAAAQLREIWDDEDEDDEEDVAGPVDFYDGAELLKFLSRGYELPGDAEGGHS